jgi:hypothetical protein
VPQAFLDNAKDLPMIAGAGGNYLNTIYGRSGFGPSILSHAFWLFGGVRNFAYRLGAGDFAVPILEFSGLKIPF